MADEGRACSSSCSRRGRNTGERVKKYTTILVFFLLLLLPAVETRRAIDACRYGRKRCAMQRVSSASHVPGSNPRRLSTTSGSTQFNVPRSRSPPAAASRVYNASKHEVPSGPNPISNR